MVFKHYNIQVIVRLLLLLMTCFLLAYSLQLDGYWFLKWNLLILLGLQFFFFYRFISRWKLDLKIFAESVRHDDYTITYQLHRKDESYKELYLMLNDISTYVRKIKSAYVVHDQYFQSVVQNAQIGLLVYNNAGVVLLSNNEALNFARTTMLRNLNQLQDYNPELFEHIISLELNKPTLIVLRRNSREKLSARLSQLVIDGKDVFLLSLLNIRPELEENELQSWQDLINVLTHEIMNSVTPIHSLTGNMLKFMDRIEGNEETVSKARNSLEVINRRSKSLMNFVDRYRTISNVPLPHFSPINVRDLIESGLTLLSSELRDVDVAVRHENQIIDVDVSQIEQVLINILRNAIFALSDAKTKSIIIETDRTGEETQIRISDSGKGIPPEIIDKIFIPFFTTRKDGSGIGLTLSRQIIQRHGGTINVSSHPGKGTTFSLIFKNKQAI